MSTIQQKQFNYTVYFEPQPEGGYNVVVPAIPEICTFGETLEEAKAMAKEAIACYLESARKHNEHIEHEMIIQGVPLREDVAVAVPV